MSAEASAGRFKRGCNLIGENLQRSVEVTGAERLERNSELLPGGTQIVLHHLHTHLHHYHTVHITYITMTVCAPLSY